MLSFMEIVSKTQAAPATSSVANTTTGVRSLLAVPVLQQMPEDHEEKSQSMYDPATGPVVNTATVIKSLPTVPVLQQKTKEPEEKPQLVEEPESGSINTSVIQRYITNDDGTPLPYSDAWNEIAKTVEGTEKLNSYINSKDGYALNAVVNALDSNDAIEPLVPFTNTTGRLDIGCSVCVAANYLKMTDKELIKSVFDEKDPVKINVIKQIYKSGDSGKVTELFMSLGIYLADESFKDYESMIEAIASDPDSPSWTGALAWEGHIIRASGEGDQFTFWDPQNGQMNCDVPKNKKLVLVTFNA